MNEERISALMLSNLDCNFQVSHYISLFDRILQIKIVHIVKHPYYPNVRNEL